MIFIFAPVFTAAFDSTPEVIRFGVERARTAALFYFLLAFSHSVAAILRSGEGSGADGYHDDFLVCGTCGISDRSRYVHFVHCHRILGISADMDIEFCRISHILQKSRLAAQFLIILFFIKFQAYILKKDICLKFFCSCY